MHPRLSSPSPARGIVSLPAIFSVLAVLFVVACNGVDSSAPSIIDLTAPQTLATVNGATLPFQELFSVYDGGLVKSDSQIFSGGGVSYNSDGSFHLTYTVRNKLFVGSQVYTDTTVVISWTGTFLVSGGNITLSFTDGTIGRTLTGTAGDGFSTINVPSTVQTTATQSTTVTHALHYSVQ